MADHPGAAHAKWMADRDRAAVDVQAGVGNTQPVPAIKHLAGKGLVEFPQIDVVDRQAMAFE
ncbi:Uncharacterised protein [Bordetella pertussis]|nr:Uncharacterised protein [Bordetella pertussis]CFW30417.1 Uncharacterised protein [Bordetella pertussis]